MKKLKFSALALSLALFTISCNKKQEKPQEQSTEPKVEQAATSLTYDIIAKNDSKIKGTVSFTQEGSQVKMEVKASGLTPGEHAIHLHQNADCSAADASSAGGHWNPAQQDHGKWEGEHFHMGDIGNMTADAEGNVDFSFSTDKWCIGCSDSLKDILNKSVIIHAKADDFVSQPSGAAGSRVGCVEIKKL